MSTNCHDCGYRDNEVKTGGAISDKGRRTILKVEDSEDLSRDILKVRRLRLLLSFSLLLTLLIVLDALHLSSPLFFPLHHCSPLSSFAHPSFLLTTFNPSMPPLPPPSSPPPASSQSETAGLTIPEIDLELNPGTLGGRFTTLEGLLQQVYEELDDKVFARGDSSVLQKEEEGEMGRFLASLKKVRFPSLLLCLSSLRLLRRWFEMQETFEVTNARSPRLRRS